MFRSKRTLTQFFCLVPSWIDFIDTPQVQQDDQNEDPQLEQEDTEQYELATVIRAQACDTPLTNFADAGVMRKHPDICALVKSTGIPQPMPTKSAVEQADYVTLRTMIQALADHCKPPSGASFVERMRFFSQLFGCEAANRSMAETAGVFKQKFHSLVTSLQTRLFDLSNWQKLATSFRGCTQDQATQFVCAGFVGAPNTCTQNQLRVSGLLTALRRNAIYYAQQEFFRFERFVNSTKTDLLFLLRMTRKNIDIGYDIACLASTAIHGEEVAPAPADQELNFAQRLVSVDNLLTPVRRTTKLFYVVLRLAGIRSIAINDRTEEVYCKYWRAVNCVGRNRNTTRSPVEYAFSSPIRSWYHTYKCVWEHPREMLQSLAGRDMQELNRRLMGNNKVETFARALAILPSFRLPKACRHFTAFNNGILDTLNLTYVEWNHPQKQLPADLTVVKFLDLEYESTYINLLLHLNEGNAMRLPFAQTRSIYKSQKWTEAEQKNIMALQGRTKIGVRELDVWDLMPLNYGISTVGKSKNMDMTHSLFNKEHVGILAAIEKKFGLESLMGRMLVIAYEINEKFGLDQALLHSLICGEGVTIPQKGKVALSEEWISQMLGASNKFPSKYKDTDFSLLRRLFIMWYTSIVRKPDPLLMNKFRNFDLQFYLYTCMWAYHTTLAQDPTASFWSLCEEKFLHTRREMMAQLSLLEGFLRSAYILPSELVRIKLNLAGSTTREHKPDTPFLQLLFAKYTKVDGVMWIQFPDSTLARTKTEEPTVLMNDLWAGLASYSKHTMRLAKAPAITPEVYEGVFERYKIHLDEEGRLWGIALQK